MINESSHVNILKLKKDYESKITEIYQENENQISNLELAFKESYSDIELRNFLLEQKVKTFKNEIENLINDKNKNDVFISSLQEKFDLFNIYLENQLYENRTKNENERLQMMNMHSQEIKSLKDELSASLINLQDHYFKEQDQTKFNLCELETKVEKYVIDLNISNVENHFLKKQLAKLENRISWFQDEIKVLNNKLIEKEKDLFNIKERCVYHAALNKQLKNQILKNSFDSDERLKELNLLNSENVNQIAELEVKIIKQNSAIETLNEDILKMKEESRILKENNIKDVKNITDNFERIKASIQFEDQEKMNSLEQKFKERNKFIQQKLYESEKLLLSQSAENRKNLEFEKKKLKDLTDRFNSVKKQSLKEKNNLLLEVDKMKKENNEKLENMLVELRLIKEKEINDINKKKNIELKSYDVKIKALEQAIQISADEIRKKNEKIESIEKEKINYENTIRQLNENDQNLIKSQMEQVKNTVFEFYLQHNNLKSQQIAEEKFNNSIVNKFEKVIRCKISESEKYRKQISNFNIFYKERMMFLKKIMVDQQKKIILLNKDLQGIRNKFINFSSSSLLQFQILSNTIKNLSVHLTSLETEIRNKNVEIKQIKDDLCREKHLLESRLENMLPIIAQQRYESIISSLKSQVSLLKEQIMSQSNQISILTNGE